MLFTKKIIQPGTYVVDRKDGSKQRVYVGPDRINQIASTFKKMTDNGLKIPAPWRHDPKAQPLRLDMDSQDVDAFQNAGFWNKVWVEKDGSLYGQLDVKDRKASSKVGKTVVECSPRLDAKWVDGSGEEYINAMTHCALVTHPVVRGQDNFQPVEDTAIALSLGAYLSQADITALPDEFAFHYADSVGVNSSTTSARGDEGFDTSAQGPTNSVKTAVQALGLAGIPLPADTDETNLAEYIVVALQAFVAGKEASDDGLSVSKPPRKSREQSSIVMSKELQAVIDNQAAIGAKLAGGEELTLEYLQGLEAAEKEPVAQFSAEQQALLDMATGQLRDTYKRRIEACVHTGKISPKIAKQYGEQLLTVTEFAVGQDGKQAIQPIDVILETWEAAEAGTFLTGKTPTTVRKSRVDVFGNQTFSLDGMNDEDPPENMEEPPTESVTGKQAEEMALSIMDAAGLSH